MTAIEKYNGAVKVIFHDVVGNEGDVVDERIQCPLHSHAGIPWFACNGIPQA
jgi:hypothetical protein